VPVRFFDLLNGIPAGVNALAPNNIVKTPRMMPSIEVFLVA
jgi:hypothetical protein